MTTQVLTYNLQKALGYRERIVSILIAMIVLASAAYIYFVHQAVVNVVSRQDIMAEIQVKNSNINDLESQYLALDNSITLDSAAQYGFVSTEVTAFIPARTSDIVATAQR